MFRYSDFLRFSCAFAVVCILLYSDVLHADKRDEQRKFFSEIERSLKAGRRNLFIAKRDWIKDYPLYPYLQFYEHRLRLKSIKEGELTSFLHKYAAVPVAQRLRREWLTILAQRGDWKMFARHYQASSLYPSKELACLYGTALIRTGQHEKARAELQSLWHVGFSQPSQCDFVFDWGFTRKLINDDWIWQRLLLAIKGKPGLADYLGKRLSPDSRRWYLELQAARKNPDGHLARLSQSISVSAFARDITAYTLVRLAKRNLDRAEKLWKKIRGAYANPRHQYALQRDLGLIAATRLDLGFAYDSLSEVPSEYHTPQSRQWLIRVAMRARRWHGALEAFSLLDQSESDESRWRYWHAVALYETGQVDEALTIWKELAQQAGYFSYLAADRLDLPYVLETRPIDIPPRELEVLDSQSAIARMAELIKLNRFVDARREFFVVADYFTSKEFLKLAVLAEQWKWNDGAIRAIAKSAFTGDTQVRFPMPYQMEIRSEAARYKSIPEEWIYGVIRRESAFMEKAKSPAGALGLMQLMPRTARALASKLNIRHASSAYILKPGVNIRLGAEYLNKLYRQYDGQLHYMLAAYNAGGTAVANWRRNAPVSDPVLWVETIPIGETRDYVPAVLYYLTIYAHRLGKKPQRLKTLMRPR